MLGPFFGNGADISLCGMYSWPILRRQLGSSPFAAPEFLPLLLDPPPQMRKELACAYPDPLKHVSSYPK